MSLSNKELIEHFYEIENMVEDEDSSYSKVTLQARIEDVAMLNVISDRFDTTRFELSRTIIRNAVSELFHHLSESDRESLAVKADAEITNQMRKSGTATFFEYPAVGNLSDESGYWRNHAAAKKGFV